MSGALSRILSVLSWPGRLTGPIFDKELRVSSRRRRNYVLRVAYVAMLTLFVALIWVNVVRWHPGAPAAYQSSRMAEAGKTIVAVIIWFQFCVTQLVAVILMSTAISDEIYHRTLGVLMTTPVTSLQIVMGKVLSKLWQILLLLAMSVPLLAVVRVFGGVPWEFVVAGVCVTLTAVLVAGSLSMFFSIFTRRAYAVILETLVGMGFLFGLLPLLVGWLLNRNTPMSDRQVVSLLANGNPALGMAVLTEELSSSWRAARMGSFSWPVHCGAMLTVSAGVLALCIVLVRRAALRQAAGETGRRKSRLPAAPTTPGAATAPEAPAPGRAIRRVTGSAILWKELRAPMLPKGIAGRVVAALAVLALLISYAVFAAENDLRDHEVQIGYCVVFVCLGMLFTAVIAATSVTSEKEARSLPLLLATPLDERHILLAKAAGVLRRCALVWAVLPAHLLLFSILEVVHPYVLFELALVAAWVFAFLTASGLYFSTVFRKTTTAVVMNLGLMLTLWAVLPLLLGLICEAARDFDVLEGYVAANPVVQTIVVVDAARARRTYYVYPGRSYHWPHGRAGSGETAAILVATAVAYWGAGLIFLAAAGRRLRRKMF